jgi:hypothetical protein
MTMDWPGISPDEVARRLALRVATAEFHEGVARVQLCETVNLALDNNSNIPAEKLEQLARQNQAEWYAHRAMLTQARMDLQAEKDRRLQNNLPLQGLSEDDIRAERARLAEGIDLAAPTPLDELLAQYPAVDVAAAPVVDDEEDDEQALRSHRRR